MPQNPRRVSRAAAMRVAPACMMVAGESCTIPDLA